MCCDITLICHFVKLIRMMSLSGLPVRLQSVSQSVRQSVRPGQARGREWEISRPRVPTKLSTSQVRPVLLLLETGLEGGKKERICWTAAENNHKLC